MCFSWPPRWSSLIPALQAIIFKLKSLCLQHIFEIGPFYFSAQWSVFPVGFFFKLEVVLHFPQMVGKDLELKQNVRSGLVPLITLGLWVRLDNVSLW